MAKVSRSKHRKHVRAKGSRRKPKKGFFWAVWIALSAVATYFFFFFVWLFRGLYNFFRFLFVKVFVRKKAVPAKTGSGELKPSPRISRISLVDGISGDFRSFLGYLKSSDSVIGIIIGARGSGKTAVALSLLENLKGSKKNFFAMGFSKEALPSWIKVVGSVSELDNDSFVVVDEGGVLFSSRESMSDANKVLSELLFVARHKNTSILFISQNSSSLEVNTLRQADFLVLKRSSLLQKSFERKIVADIYSEYDYKFREYRDVRGLSLVYSDKFVGFVENELPSFWSDKASKSFK